MKNKIIFLAFIIQLALSSCEMPNDPIPGTYDKSVNAILVTCANSQKIFLFSTPGLNESYRKDEYTDTIKRALFIRNADVRVNNRAFKEIIPVYDDWSPYYELKQTDFVRPDLEYNLNIITEKSIITGKTKSPNSFSIISHPKESTIKLSGSSEKIKITWSKSLDAKGYEFQAVYPTTGRNWDGTFYNYDSLSTPELIKDTCFVINITDKYSRIRVKVGAYDENFENYYINKKYSSGVKGAYGVFCSMVVDSIVINVVKD